jgi:putative endonuclease
MVPRFTQKYGVHSLVYFEETGNIESAINREKQLKKWRRSWKLALIDGTNPDWKDLGKKLYLDHQSACGGMDSRFRGNDRIIHL